MSDLARRDGPRCCACGGEATKAIYYGLPGWICLTDECSTAGGLAFDLATILHLPFNGWVTHYTGSYWSALWAWLRDDETP